MNRLDAIQVYRGATLILALAALTERERQAVVAHAYHGLTFPETARLLGMSHRQNAEKFYQRGMRRLAETLEADRELLAETIA